ncbi:MAG TPA: M23 family metallopeptidase [Candidatus Deferrimicrobiaceae bacterium]|jgi:hypothetical protein
MRWKPNYTILLWAFCFILFSNLATAGPPELKLPLQDEEKWIVTVGYNGSSTHINKDYYALDFAQSECNAWRKSVRAAAPGTARTYPCKDANCKEDYGKYVLIDHGDGYFTRYAHLDSFSIEDGKWVEQGQEIGKLGNTGNVDGKSCLSHQGLHLHFAMYKDGAAYKPEPMDDYSNIKQGIVLISSNREPKPNNNWVQSTDEYSCIKSINDGKLFCWEYGSDRSCSKGKLWFYNDIGKHICSLSNSDICKIELSYNAKLVDSFGGYDWTFDNGEMNAPASRTSTIKIKSIGLCDDGNNDPKHVLEKTPDARYHIHIVIKNEGKHTAKNIEIKYYISNDKTFGDKDDDYIASDWIDSIAAGEVHDDRKTKDNNNNPLKTPDDVGEYYVYAHIINHGDGTSDISSNDDKDEYGNLTIKDYVPPPPPKIITITDPTGGTWKTDRKHTINWKSENLPKSTHVKIEYTLDSNNWHILTDSAPNDGGKSWNMEDKPFRDIIKKDTDKAKIRITSVEYPKVSATSPRFKIDHKK